MKMTLKEWQEHYHEVDEYQKVFYLMDKTMKNIHENGYYLASFDWEKIVLYQEENKNIVSVEYLSLLPLDMTTRSSSTNQNIYNLAFLEVGIYTSTLEYLKPSFVKENFEQMKYFLPQEDIPYYTRVLRDGAFIYYSEYKDALYKKTLTSLEKDLSIDGGNGKNQTLTKSTPYSALYTSNDESNKAAFVHYFALPFLIISLSFLIPLFAFLFALMGRF